MPIPICGIKKDIVKRSILNGNSFQKSMKIAGYAKNTAHQASKSQPVIKQVLKEIAEEFKMSNITTEKVLKNLHQDRKFAYRKGDIASAIRTDELTGKWLGMFKDGQTQINIISVDKRQALEALASQLAINEVKQ